jgi:subtilisin family serine protease
MTRAGVRLVAMAAGLGTKPEGSSAGSTKRALALVGLFELMQHTRGRPQTRIGLIDGPVATDHPDLATQTLEYAPRASTACCHQSEGSGCEHGTFIAGILCASRSAAAPGICSDCTLLLHPVFTEPAFPGSGLPSASPSAIVDAIIDCVEAGVHVINLSVAEVYPPFADDPQLCAALDFAAHRGVLVVAAAGNQGVVSGSPIARHPWVIPVVPCTLDGLPLAQSNLSGTIAKRGLTAPGVGIASLAVGARPVELAGSSVAAPLVTGTIGLLLSEFSGVPAGEIRYALTTSPDKRRHALVPPLLDAWRAFQYLTTLYPRRAP